MEQQEMKDYLEINDTILTVNNTLNSSFFFNFKDGSTVELKNVKDLQDFLDQVNNWKVYKEMLQTLKKDLAYLDECLFLDEDTDPEVIIKHASRELTEIRYKLRKCLEGE